MSLPCVAEAVKAQQEIANGDAEVKPAAEPGVETEPAGKEEDRVKSADGVGEQANGDGLGAREDAEPAEQVGSLRRHALPVVTGNSGSEGLHSAPLVWHLDRTCCFQ